MAILNVLYSGTKYDANKVAKEEKEAKERQLKKIDEARKKASEKSVLCIINICKSN